ncbi:DUF4192 domain-containing protein [Mycobacterium xenopi]|uniref:DUF4192 domain-containing protein n=1 Tax=Mycobacterium xenopi TaxID=1789 RepID=UPI000A152D20|nr:DUF4192 domain-containing protein [Mycobacterium xenopi]ORX19439.1 hypothetical protein AWC32_10725 [Mycobacterium xenopi]SPX94803.1 Uncharacterised protein [Mycobacterium xenopi]
MHTIESPGELIAGIAPTLGFPPVESLVIVTVAGGLMNCTMRLDLRDAGVDGTVDRLAELAVRNGADGVVAVIVSAEAASCPICARQFRDLSGDLDGALGRRGARLLGAFVVDRIQAGGRWHCVDNCGGGGVLNDPAASVMAAAAVAAGHRMYKDRDELKASVAVDSEHAAAVAPLLDGALNRVGCVAVAVREVVAAVHRMAEGTVPSDGELASIGAALGDVRVRDLLFTTADSDVAASAEALWTLLARILPPRLRVEALTLLAFSAYLRGEGPLAGIALDAALAEEPHHRMARMLDTALQRGVRPDELRELLSGIPSAMTV